MTATADAMSTKTIDVTFMVKRLKQVGEEDERERERRWVESLGGLITHPPLKGARRS